MRFAGSVLCRGSALCRGSILCRGLALCCGLTLCCAAVLACGDDALGPTDGLVLEVDRSSYTAVPVQPAATLYEFRVVATFTNGRRDVVYLARCRADAPVPAHGVRSPTGRPVAYDPVRSCPADVPGIAVQPGERRTDTLTIAGPWVVDGGTGRPVGEMEGRFRLFYYVGDAENPNPVPEFGWTPIVSSGEFQVLVRPTLNVESNGDLRRTGDRRWQ